MDLEKRKEEIKKILLEPSDLKGAYLRPDIPIKSPKENHESEHPISGKLYKLATEYGAFKPLKTFSYSDYTPGDRSPDLYYEERTFIPYEKCDIKEKQKIEELETKIAQILEDKSNKYDQKGKIKINIYENRKATTNFEEDHQRLSDTLEIEVTPRELAKAGILYSELDWKSLEQIKEEMSEKKVKVSTKDIAETGKSLTTTEMGGIKGFFHRLLNKFKGLGEK